MLRELHYVTFTFAADVKLFDEHRNIRRKALLYYRLHPLDLTWTTARAGLATNGDPRRQMRDNSECARDWVPIAQVEIYRTEKRFSRNPPIWPCWSKEPPCCITVRIPFLIFGGEAEVVVSHVWAERAGGTTHSVNSFSQPKIRRGFIFKAAADEFDDSRIVIPLAENIGHVAAEDNAGAGRIGAGGAARTKVRRTKAAHHRLGVTMFASGRAFAATDDRIPRLIPILGAGPLD